MTSASTDLRARLETTIRDIPDFPSPGIIYKDITPVLADARLFRDVMHAMSEPYQGQHIDHVVGLESRGFVFSAPMAYLLGTGFVPIRKLGKLPYETIRVDYTLEYGASTLELHSDAIKPGERVLIVDDLLATGGTVSAGAHLVEQLGGVVVGLVFLIELAFLQGRQRVEQYPIYSLIRF